MDRFPLDRFPPEQPAGPASAPPLATYSPSQSSVLPAPPHTLFRSPDEQDPFKISFLKGPKRKRLAKACDACHKSKRRCDGTAPCGNCYFAAKDCTYTDSSGRAVPAPRASGADKPARSGPSQPRRRPQRDAHLESPVPASTNSLSSLHSEPLTSPQDPSDTRDDYAESSKRPRRGSISSFPAPESQAHVPLAPRSTFATTRFEVPVVRELVNLFFAHCHPHRLVIHQPTFMADVTLGRVPSYLLYAMCALAAPFSKHPAVRAESPRTAGSAYSKAAEEQMFDMNGRLNVERSLMTAQALCLLESHQFLLSFPWPSPSSNHHLALSILKEDLNVQEESQSGLSSAPTTSFVLDAIGRECARRAFWYIKLMHLTTFAYYRMPALPSSMDLALRLPVDEASFEFGVHNSQSEFLHLPAPRTQYASEYGHLLRIASVHGHLEGVLAAADGGSSTHDAVMAVVEDTEKAISAWETSLADHVRFSEESTALHLAMFETSSNAGAWCYFMMHTVYAWCLLTLSEAKARGSGIVVNDCREWARDRLVLIGTKLGGRSKNSVLLVAILTALNRHGLSDQPQIQAWMKEYTEASGMELPTKAMLSLRMPLAEAMASVGRPALPPPLPPTPVFTTSADRLEDRGETSSTGSGTYFSSLRNSYNKLRVTDSAPRSPVPGPASTSLPSLKSCGLLDPWVHHSQLQSQQQPQPPQPPPQQPPQQPLDAAGMSEPPSSPPPPWMVMRDAPTPKDSAAGSSEVATSIPASSRGTTSAMPVGLDWLAHER